MFSIHPQLHPYVLIWDTSVPRYKVVTLLTHIGILDSRANFTLISSFFLHLFVSAENVDNARECLDMLENWRAALRLKSRSCDLLNLALLRLDGVFVRGLGEVVELGEGARVVWAERGGA